MLVNEKPSASNQDVRKEKSQVHLFDIFEQPDGKFLAVLPGLTQPEMGIVGTTQKTFDTREEAEAAVENSQENLREHNEKQSLAKYYSNFYRINKKDEGLFEVVSPGLKHEDGYYVGTTKKEFRSWSEARDYFLEKFRSHEKLAESPLLEIDCGPGVKISFSDFEAFDPKVTPSETPLEIPAVLQKHILRREQLAGTHIGSSTYQETVNEKGWERKLFLFLKNYLENDGKDLLKEMDIKGLDVLTPRQAVEIATKVVLRLTRYKLSDVKGNESHSEPNKKTDADEMTVLTLLQEGLKKKDDPNWEGNGICRNFASMTKAVFEGLKANQTQMSRLTNTYSLYEGDFESFDPTVKKDNFLTTSGETEAKMGHAWNTFVTVSEQGANVVILDTTWGKLNPETGETEQVDYTLTRMEPMVASLSDEPIVQNPQQIERILQYYGFKADKPGGVDAVRVDQKEPTREEFLRFGLDAKTKRPELFAHLKTEEQFVEIGRLIFENIIKQNEEKKKKQKERDEAKERRFFVKKAWQIAKKSSVEQLPAELVPLLNQEFLDHTDELEVDDVVFLHKLKKTTFGFNYLTLYKKYFISKPMDNRHTRFFVFDDIGLQKMSFEFLKDRPEFQKFVETVPEFRSRLRSALPEYFSDFDPAGNQGDLKELKYLLESNPRLSRLSVYLSGSGVKLESIQKVFELVREMLRKINPEYFDTEKIGAYEDYELVKKFRDFENELKSKL